MLTSCAPSGGDEYIARKIVFTVDEEDPRVAFFASSLEDLPFFGEENSLSENKNENSFVYSSRPIVDVYFHAGNRLIFVKLGEFDGRGCVLELRGTGFSGVRWTDK
jgi:hypothetical protein